jgi:hypothetical protein
MIHIAENAPGWSDVSKSIAPFRLMICQAVFRRRRHQARRPPPAKIRPGSPAPAMGPGTAVMAPNSPSISRLIPSLKKRVLGLPLLPPVKGRCRLHGGASGSGGPPGERNGQFRHGERTKGAITERAEIQHIAENAPRRADVSKSIAPFA